MVTLDIQMYKMTDWLSTAISEFWLILNYSKLVWDIDTKFLPVVVLINIQLSTKFGASSYAQNGFPAKTILNFKRAWRVEEIKCQKIRARCTSFESTFHADFKNSNHFDRHWAIEESHVFKKYCKNLFFESRSPYLNAEKSSAIVECCRVLKL